MKSASRPVVGPRRIAAAGALALAAVLLAAVFHRDARSQADPPTTDPDYASAELCTEFGGVLQTAADGQTKICSGIDRVDTFCIVGSVDAFPCRGLYKHVRQCNNKFDRPALNPFLCAPKCQGVETAKGARCGVPFGGRLPVDGEYVVADPDDDGAMLTVVYHGQRRGLHFAYFADAVPPASRAAPGRGFQLADHAAYCNLGNDRDSGGTAGWRPPVLAEAVALLAQLEDLDESPVFLGRHPDHLLADVFAGEPAPGDGPVNLRDVVPAAVPPCAAGAQSCRDDPPLTLDPEKRIFVAVAFTVGLPVAEEPRPALLQAVAPAQNSQRFAVVPYDDAINGDIVIPCALAADDAYAPPPNPVDIEITPRLRAAPRQFSPQARERHYQDVLTGRAPYPGDKRRIVTVMANYLTEQNADAEIVGRVRAVAARADDLTPLQIIWQHGRGAVGCAPGDARLCNGVIVAGRRQVRLFADSAWLHQQPPAPLWRASFAAPDAAALSAQHTLFVLTVAARHWTAAGYQVAAGARLSVDLRIGLGEAAYVGEGMLAVPVAARADIPSDRPSFVTVSVAVHSAAGAVRRAEFLFANIPVFAPPTEEVAVTENNATVYADILLPPQMVDEQDAGTLSIVDDDRPGGATLHLHPRDLRLSRVGPVPTMREIVRLQYAHPQMRGTLTLTFAFRPQGGWRADVASLLPTEEERTRDGFSVHPLEYASLFHLTSTVVGAEFVPLGPVDDDPANFYGFDFRFADPARSQVEFRAVPPRLAPPDSPDADPVLGDYFYRTPDGDGGFEYSRYGTNRPEGGESIVQNPATSRCLPMAAAREAGAAPEDNTAPDTVTVGDLEVTVVFCPPPQRRAEFALAVRHPDFVNGLTFVNTVGMDEDGAAVVNTVAAAAMFTVLITVDIKTVNVVDPSAAVPPERGPLWTVPGFHSRPFTLSRGNVSIRNDIRHPVKRLPLHHEVRLDFARPPDGFALTILSQRERGVPVDRPADRGNGVSMAIIHIAADRALSAGERRDGVFEITTRHLNYNTDFSDNGDGTQTPVRGPSEWRVVAVSRLTLSLVAAAPASVRYGGSVFIPDDLDDLDGMEVLPVSLFQNLPLPNRAATTAEREGKCFLDLTPTGADGMGVVEEEGECFAYLGATKMGAGAAADADAGAHFRMGGDDFHNDFHIQFNTRAGAALPVDDAAARDVLTGSYLVSISYESPRLLGEYLLTFAVDVLPSAGALQQQAQSPQRAKGNGRIGTAAAGAGYYGDLWTYNPNRLHHPLGGFHALLPPDAPGLLAKRLPNGRLAAARVITVALHNPAQIVKVEGVDEVDEVGGVDEAAEVAADPHAVVEVAEDGAGNLLFALAEPLPFVLPRAGVRYGADNAPFRLTMEALEVRPGFAAQRVTAIVHFHALGGEASATAPAGGAFRLANPPLDAREFVAAPGAWRLAADGDGVVLAEDGTARLTKPLPAGEHWRPLLFYPADAAGADETNILGDGIFYWLRLRVLAGADEWANKLIAAAAAGRYAEAVAALSAGADPNHIPQTGAHAGHGALHRAVANFAAGDAAARAARLSVIWRLAEAGAQPWLTDADGYAPMHRALFAAAEAADGWPVMALLSARYALRPGNVLGDGWLAEYRGHPGWAPAADGTTTPMLLALREYENGKARGWAAAAAELARRLDEDSFCPRSAGTRTGWEVRAADCLLTQRDAILHAAADAGLSEEALRAVASVAADAHAGFARSRNRAGETALHIATRNALTAHVRALLATGADVNAGVGAANQLGGASAMHYAISLRSPALVSLLAHGFLAGTVAAQPAGANQVLVPTGECPLGIVPTGTEAGVFECRGRTNYRPRRSWIIFADGSALPPAAYAARLLALEADAARRATLREIANMLEAAPAPAP